jgi:PAS domain S-box-containing protein
MHLDFQALFESAPGCLLVLAPDQPRFTILAATDAYLEATKTRREEVVGRGVFEVFPDNPDAPDSTGGPARASFERVLERRSPDAMAVQRHDIPLPESEGGGFEERHWSPLNTPVLAENGDVRCIIHRVEDVTDSVRAREKGAEQQALVEALRESEERLRVALAATALGIWDYNPASGALNWDARCKELFGLPPEAEVNYDTFLAGLHPEDREPTHQAIQRSLGPASGGLYDIEYRTVGQHDGGVVRWVRATGRALFNHTGQATRFIGTVQDITERKAAEGRLRQAAADLQAANAALRASRSAALNLMEDADITRHRAEEATAALRESEERVRRKLESVLSPEGDLGVLDLADLIDVPAFQRLMDEFHAVAGIPMAILDVKGRVLVRAGWQDICTRFHRVQPDTCRHCLESDTQLSAGLAQGEFRLYKCRNNLWDMATPIIVGGEHLGNIFTGQFFFEDETVDRESFRAQARRYGFDEEAYLAALDRVPRLSHETVDRGMAFFLQLADMLSQLGYSNVKLGRLLAERDRLTDSLRESEERLRLLGDNLPDSAVYQYTHEPDGGVRFVHMSAGIERLNGVSVEEVLRDAGVLHRQSPPEYVVRFVEAEARSAREMSDFDMELPMRRPDGEVRWMRLHSRPRRLPDGRVLWDGVQIDVTERKLAEEAMRRTAEDLKRSNEDLEQFAYVASHDLQEPLRAVSGFLKLLEDRYRPQLDDRAREYIDFSVEGALRMSSLIHDLLAYSRVGRKGRPAQPTDANGALAAALTSLRGSIENASAAITRDELPTVHADPTQLAQVFQNLIGNAIKFRHPDRSCQIHVCARKEADHWVFSVRDNGIGIDPKQRDRIFVIFQRLHTRDKYPGTGIGLSICKKIVERHGGRIWVESKAGEGSTFCFTLPQEGIG